MASPWRGGGRGGDVGLLWFTSFVLCDGLNDGLLSLLLGFM